MKELLEKILKVITVLLKIIPVIIDVLSDFADDGKRNNSIRPKQSKSE